MPELSQFVQTADWKKEKHVPVIECPDQVTVDEFFEVKVSVGKEIAHPNTLEHYIAWITLYFHPEGSKFPVQIGHFAFTAHGESDTFTAPAVKTMVKVNKPGTFHALSYCNIHGLWESSKKVGLA